MENTINQRIKEAHRRVCRKKLNLNYSPNSAEIQEEINLMEAEPKKGGKEKRGRKPTSPESIFLIHGKSGTIMYSIREGKYIESLMAYYNRGATTEVCYCVCPRTLQTEKLTKVTIK